MSRVMRASTWSGRQFTPSKPRALQATRARPCRFSDSPTNGLVMPTTLRYQRGVCPVIAVRMDWVRPIWSSMAAGPSRQKRVSG